ncbi:hypothetical protein OBBRIDRAFT_827226 [Obba rivulosa]|uniref:Glutathione S-transferase n=1 Tax=Obba rivulosa TaxID=1052685 RepID=A0A8E2AS25_9APHY|nr:hypothetical protein OBBRIDRAFT_827226 [Obba rivulosa]
MAPKEPVVLYQYDTSPISTKIKNVLTLKHIPHKRVHVAEMPPRPELLILGVTYRRIPVLAIGNDVYCDSSLIASILEQRYPASEGYGTIFPKRKGGGSSDPGVAKVFSTFYMEKIIFPLVSGSLPFHRFAPEFIKDRQSMGMKFEMDAKVAEARYPFTKSALASHLMLLEEQLADGREWLLDTETPSLADISAHIIYDWMKRFKSVRDVYREHKYPRILSWLQRFSEYLGKQDKDNASPFQNISGQEAADIIQSSVSQDADVVGFDDVESGRLQVKRGDIVAITPADNAKVPTVGTLIALNREETVIEISGNSGRIVRCHFPRLNFSIKPVTESKAKL